jgi:hypothetical protein
MKATLDECGLSYARSSNRICIEDSMLPAMRGFKSREIESRLNKYRWNRYGGKINDNLEKQQVIDYRMEKYFKTPSVKYNARQFLSLRPDVPSWDKNTKIWPYFRTTGYKVYN